MSHRAAAPPSLMTRLLHGARPGTPPLRLASPAKPQPRPIAKTTHPLFSGMLSKTLLLAGAVIVFLGGFLSGRLATTAWPDPLYWFGSGKPLQSVVLDKLQTELRLTPAQTAQIRPIIAGTCANLRLVSEESRAQRLALLDEIGATIAPDLTDTQRHRLEDLEAEWQHRPTVKRDERIVALY